MLKQTAQENGYNKELCGFLGVLEARFKLQGVGCIHVEKALEKQIPEHAIIKVALANIGNVFPAETGDKPESAFTTEDIIAEGEEEYKKHLDKDGKFRYSDFTAPGKPDTRSSDSMRHSRTYIRARDAIPAA